MRKMNSEGNVEDIRIGDEIYKKFKSFHSGRLYSSINSELEWEKDIKAILKDLDT